MKIKNTTDIDKNTNQILKSKMQIPQEVGIALERTTLLNTLYHCKERIIVLHGEAGYGKTELARQYCCKGNKKALWYSLDKLDNSPWRFLTYLDLIFAEQIDGYKTSDFVNQEPSDCICQIVHETVAAVNASEEKSFVLVLDSLESIYDKSIYDLLEYLLEYSPPNLQILCINRYCMPDFFSRYVVNGTCKMIDEAELAFSAEEQNYLIRQELKNKCENPVGILTACEMLEGWPACLMLALRCIRKRTIGKESVDWRYLLQDSMIYSFLNCEIFEKLSEDEKMFLVSTSELMEVDTRVCDKILDTKDSKNIIKNLLKKNIFAHTVSGDYGKLQYHRIFRLFLSEIPDNKVQEQIAKSAAEFYLKEKDYKRALEQSIHIGYTDLIVKIIETYGEEMLFNDEDAALDLYLTYLEQKEKVFGIRSLLIENKVATPEMLGVAAEYYYKKGSHNKAENYLNQADSSFGKENKYAMYRSLYRGVLRYSEDPQKYERQINNALFFLQENRIRLPYLRDTEKEIIKLLSVEKEVSKDKKKHLKVNVFGDFQVLIIDEDRQLPWRTKKGCELFAYLVELDGKAVGRRQILQKLWEDELPDNAVTMLHNMLYNIRKELASCGLAELIQYKDKRYSINMEEIETDIEEIKYICTLVDKENAKELEQYSEWFKVYWGRYIEGIDSQWVMEQKEYYDTRFLKGCMLLADTCIERADYQNGVIFLKNALLINSYSEELVCSLLRCYGAMHNLKQVKTEYSRCSALLERDLGIKPGKELEETYRWVIKTSR